MARSATATRGGLGEAAASTIPLRRRAGSPVVLASVVVTLAPEPGAASANSLRGVSGVLSRTWLPCRPRPGSSSGYTHCQGLDRASYPCTSPHTFKFLYFIFTIVNLHCCYLF